jgi:hypothetical protein
MKQLELITKASIKTPKNVRLMKKTFTHGYSLGMVSHETYKKVLTTNYARGI